MLTDMAAIDSSAAANTFRERTRQRQWEQLSRGLYVPRASPLSEVLRGWELVLPKSAAFTSLTAAELEGWWLPEAETVHGLRITTAAETLLAAARDLGVLDLVILGDSALRRGDCTLEELHATAAQQR